MKYSLLDLTQTVLSSIDSDEINSINDSVESQQVVKIIRTVYYDILSRANLPEAYSMVNLTASNDTTKPVIMTVPDAVDKIMWLKYDNYSSSDPTHHYEYVTFIPVEDFFSKMHQLNPNDSSTRSFTYVGTNGSFLVQYRNDKAPQWYTSFDDTTLLFDSYDSAQDMTLQSSKTVAYAKDSIPFTLSDTFVPNLDEPQFGLLLNEAKSLAWAELRQAQNAKAEQSAKRNWTSLQKTKNKPQVMSDFDQLPYYGKK